MPFTIEGLQQFKIWIVKARGASEKAQTKILQQLVNESVQHMQSSAPVDTGFLRSNISGQVTGKSSAMVQSTAFYSGFVNFGTRYMNAQPYFSDGVEVHNGKG